MKPREGSFFISGVFTLTAGFAGSKERSYLQGFATARPAVFLFRGEV